MHQGRAHEQEPRRAPARPGDRSGTDPPPSPSCCPSSLHTTHGPTRPKGRGGSSYSKKNAGVSPRIPNEGSGRSPAASPKGSPRCTRVEPTSKKRGAPLPVPKPIPALRATAPSPSRVAPARGIPMADSPKTHRGPPPAVVGQLADDGGGRRSTPGPCAHQARGLRFEGAAARAVVPFLQPVGLLSPARGEVQKGGRRVSKPGTWVTDLSGHMGDTGTSIGRRTADALVGITHARQVTIH
jgi:hypothetical protein